MIIKVKLEGALLEALKVDAEQNLRTHPAQIIYYLRQIYADQLGIPAGATPATSIVAVAPIKSPEDLTIVKQVQEVATIVQEEQTEEPLVPQQEQPKELNSPCVNEESLDEDILDFFS